MLERAIENWLINTNERNYQLAFAQVLLYEGHELKYVSQHRSLEQGKDVITIDNKGEYCAYQLKTGDININKWRLIRGEIIDLISIQIVHPSFNKSKIHKSYLVTNGTISDEVRHEIDLLNQDNVLKKRSYSYLDYIDKPALVTRFINASKTFYPKDINKIPRLNKLISGDSRDFIDKETFYYYLIETFFQDNNETVTARNNSIHSSIILAAFILSKYEDSKNYFSLFEGWVCTLSAIIYYCSKYKLNIIDNIYQDILNEIYITCELLFKEFMSKEYYFEGSLFGDGKDMYRARLTIVFGLMCAFENYRKKKAGYKVNIEYKQLLLDHLHSIILLGELSFPLFYNIIKYLESNKEEESARLILHKLLEELLTLSTPRNGIGLPNPYYSINDVLLNNLESELRLLLKIPNDILKNTIDYRNFSGGSFIIENIVSMLVRRNCRAILENYWSKISKILHKRFLPMNIYDYFLYVSSDGKNIYEFPKSTQSYEELKVKYSKVDELNEINKYIDFMPFFIIAFPFRINYELISLIDTQ